MTCCAAIITSTLLYLVNWEDESAKAKALVMKADLAEALMIDDVEQNGEDSYEPPEPQSECLKSKEECHIHIFALLPWGVLLCH